MDYPIPANDDSSKTANIITSIMADAVIEAQSIAKVRIAELGFDPKQKEDSATQEQKPQRRFRERDGNRGGERRGGNRGDNRGGERRGRGTDTGFRNRRTDNNESGNKGADQPTDSSTTKPKTEQTNKTDSVE